MNVLISDVSALEGETPDAKLRFEPFFGWQAVDVSRPAITGLAMPDMESRLILRRAFSDYE
jgi:hypothetical protein